jgi:riboflavin-specific deaminase-like protein
MPFWRELERLKAARPTQPTRPFVTAAFAISCDGCLAGARGCSSAISGPPALRVTHQLRATHDALLVGVGTVISDDPLLTTRLVPGPSPLRVVLDSHLRTPDTARLFRAPERQPWLVTTERTSSRRAQTLQSRGARLIQVAGSGDGVSLPAILAHLSACGVRSLMLEGGAHVLESFFRGQCVDYVALTVSPQRLDNPGAVALGEFTRATLRNWRAHYSTLIGNDRLDAGPCRSQQVPAPVLSERTGLTARAAPGRS